MDDALLGGLVQGGGNLADDVGRLAGIDPLSDAYRTGEPKAAIAAFFAAKKVVRS